MPIYCHDLSFIIKKWYDTLRLKKPENCRASLISYKSFMKESKKQFIENILKLLEKLAKGNITIIPINDKNEIIFIQPTSKL